MSYILDALRKADAQRERGAPRGIHAQPVPLAPNEEARSWRTVALWALPLVLVAGGAAWMLWPAQEPRPAAAVAAATPSQPAAVALPPAPVVLPPPATAAAPSLSGGAAPQGAPSLALPPALPSAPQTAPQPAPQRTAQPAPQPASPSARSLAPSAAPMPAPPSAQSPSPSAAPSPPPATAAAPRPPANPTAMLMPAPPPATMPAPGAGMGPAPGPAAPAPASSRVAATVPTGSPDRIPGFAELPPEVQREVPKLAISGGVYSENAAQRMLIVGGQVVGEGTELAPGLVLEQIRPKTAVLRLRGQRFTVAY